ncbi:MAG TPA: peptidase T [Lacibacter sp.]|nr:peptidase T [Lacibacter sp.]
MEMQISYGTAGRLMRYVQMDTQSDPQAATFPSTEKQKQLSRLLVQELQQLGIADAETDAYGYVYATIPATTGKEVPVICFCAHVDTAPDCSGTGVRPLLHRNYNGGPLVLPDDPAQVLTASAYPYLQEHVGKDIITAAGTTLLGADDKAGVAIIMSMAAHLMQHPEIPHGAVRILFTPDEEVGRGTEQVDLKKLGAVAGYTLDGGERGMLEDETFSADAVKLVFRGVSAHPGYAKGILVNALKVAGYFLDQLPKDSWSPETTEKREGFVHPVSLLGTAEQAVVELIVRDFTIEGLQQHETRLRDLAQAAVQVYPGSAVEVHIREQYRNIKEVLDQHPQVVAFAEEAYRRCGIPVRKDPIRGGTDGSRLSYMGLPCPNLFTGMQAIHSKHEWIGVSDMEDSVAMLVQLVQVWEEKA